MRKFSEIKGEEALDVMADILVPITDIATDEEVREGFNSKNMAKAVSIALKKYKKEVMQILATIDGKPVEEVEFDLTTLPIALVELMNEPVVQNLFQ